MLAKQGFVVMCAQYCVWACCDDDEDDDWRLVDEEYDEDAIEDSADDVVPVCVPFPESSSDE